MPPKCNKVKNPCKICLETVNHKTGLQCQGACRKWVHFACLNYTPGKINDIKKGIIRVTCPCPDCRTTAPKEFLADEPFSCTNIQCPSNLPRNCTSNTCPSNTGGPLQLCEKEACKKNKSPGMYAAPPSAGVNFPSSSPGSSRCSPKESPHVRGDMGNKSGAGQALNVVEQICTTVGQLSNQINCLMNEMKNLMGQQSKSAGGQQSGCPAPGCNHPGPQTRSCNCPGNPR